ncbi:unnamed protein product [Leptidea sinapis]|uniref:AAA+ ATPase domain-containing protein n=1 Tax=Leptidea sinapis TaxID=189913 RepID=A0A5E4QIP8_9NEOP|nr:unnamed protein product [Leptidea sinapis]
MYMDTKHRKLKVWAEIIPEFLYDCNKPFFETLVPTIDTVRYGYLFQKLLGAGKPVMFTGNTGVGKTVIAAEILNRMAVDGIYIPVILNFSAQTSSMRTQEVIELRLEKRPRRAIGAPLGKKVIIFIDDVNMPRLDVYGAQPTIELLRQFLDFGGVYDRDKLYWKEILDVVLSCACAPPGGGRNPLTARFTRHFAMFYISAPNSEAMKTIFKVSVLGEPIVNAAVEVYQKICNELLPTPAKSHYVFNLRDLSKCMQGVLQVSAALFYHECLRVFHDRLINIQDKSYFYHLMASVCTKYFQQPILEIPEDAIIEQPPFLLLGDFLNSALPKENRTYEEIPNLEKLMSVLKFHDDLRKMYMKAGANSEDTVFLFTDTQITKEEFLEDINNMLNSGEVPNLFEGDTYEQVQTACRPDAAKAGINPADRDAVYYFFINRVRAKLHLCICMSPVGEAFRRRCRMFPSLVNCCTIDWFTKWPPEALLSVAEQCLQPMGDAAIIEKISKLCVTMHEDVDKMTDRLYDEMRRYFYTTPSSYLDLLKLYLVLLDKKQQEIIRGRDRISCGLQKLYETYDVVGVMEQQVREMEPILAKKAEEIKAEEVKAIADEAKADLALAMPAMEAAQNALKALNKADINELKAFQKPPTLVRFVMEPVCILLGAKPDWDSTKKLLADVNFIGKLEEYDKDHIPEATLKKIKVYLVHKDFNPDTVVKVSKVCRSMVLWVQAIDMYAKVFRVVEPKIIKHKEAAGILKSVMAVLRAKQKEVEAIEAQLAKMMNELQVVEEERLKLQADVDLAGARLSRAGKLTQALADEQTRWEDSVKAATQLLHCTIGDIIIASGCIAYFGAFPSHYRRELETKWVEHCNALEIPSSDNFDLISVMADSYTVRTWNAQGLPRDAVSTENGILVTRAGRWPLTIDPQEQAGRLLIHLGDSDIEYDTNFRLYMTTKLANPHYLPEICIQVTLVNFTVTLFGLEEQLLADVVRLERPDLEVLRTELIVRINADKATLLEIEDKILRLLYASSGNILDDEELIETLNEKTEATEVNISAAREKYRTVATRGAVLYFAVAMLADIDPMYQFSLKYFTQIFSLVIEKSEKSDVLETRLQILHAEITLSVYRNVSRGLFERHKLVFSFLLNMAIYLHCGHVTQNQFNFILRGPAGTKVVPPKKPLVEAMTDQMWLAVHHLNETDDTFKGLVDDCMKKITITIGTFNVFATEMGVRDKVHSISLGQGQGPVAEKMINAAKPKGDWVFLQNCHLAASWMLSLEVIVAQMSGGEATGLSPDFRLFLSSMPTPKFPVSVLQNSVKVTNEPPKGLKANVKRALIEMDEDFFENHVLGQDWRTMLFGICMFHAIIQERKKFGPLGWNITYEFNNSDRECAMLNLQMFCEDGHIPWDALEYITSQITYGGRVTDMWDQRCLTTILTLFFSAPTLEEDYTYSSSGIYYCPRSDKLEQFRDYIESLPGIEQPDVFGMHENANIAFENKESSTLIQTIVDVQPRSGGSGGGDTPEQIVWRICDQTRTTVPNKIDKSLINPDMMELDDMGQLHSLTTVLLHETDRFNKLLALIHVSLNELQKAIKGVVVMSEAYEEVFNSFLNNKVPGMWHKQGYNSLKSLGSWIHDLTLRVDFIEKWLVEGAQPSSWVSGLFFPQGLLTGSLQAFARRYRVPIDALMFDFDPVPFFLSQEDVYKHSKKKVKDESVNVFGPIERPEDGVNIHGLFIDAGRSNEPCVACDMVQARAVSSKT